MQATLLWGRPVHLETGEITEQKNGETAKVGRALDTY